MADQLHRTNLNLYEEDVEWLEKTYGYGWTQQVREIVHGYIRKQVEAVLASEEIDNEER